MRRSSLLALACSGAMAATLVAAAPSQAAPGDQGPQTVVDGLVGPLSLAVHDGSARITVAQSFAGLITSVDNKGRTTDLASYEGEPGTGEVVGVSLGPQGTYYINTDFAGLSSHVRMIDSRGQVTTVSDNFMAYEMDNNPDQDVSYGFQGLSTDCTAQLQAFQDGLGEGPEAPHLVGYTGIVDSHPYQTSVTRQGDVYVADAAANAILKVDGRTGAISTVAVIPAPDPVQVTAEMVGDILGPDAPTCIADHDFVAEPVPTDVEIGNDGMLYVSTLGGGLGESMPLSSVYRVDPSTGDTTELADGLWGATGLDLLGQDIVVAEMFGSEVSVIRPGSSTAETLLEGLSGPADVEVHANTVYISTMAGEVLRHKVG